MVEGRRDRWDRPESMDDSEGDFAWFVKVRWKLERREGGSARVLGIGEGLEPKI